MNDTAPILKMNGISKRFGSTAALDGVNLEVLHGEVHALIGENGAGKTTLMKVLSGALKPDSGEIILNGLPFIPENPLHARLDGISMIYQELNLASHLTVEKNITLGIEEHTLGFVRQKLHEKKVGEALSLLYHSDIPLHTPVNRLSISARQIVEIARSLVSNSRIVVMDEPTSSLSRKDTEILFQVIRRLKSSGVSVIYISHFLEEVREIADRFTVLRDGQFAGSGVVKKTDTRTIIEMMVGRTLDDMFPRVKHEISDVILDISSLAGENFPLDASFSLHRGEILGIAGLVGAGRTEMLRALYGLDPIRRGEVKLYTFSESSKWVKQGPSSRIARGLGYLSEDRAMEGLALSRPIMDNITLSSLPRLSSWGWLNLRMLSAETSHWIGEFSIRTTGPLQPVNDLSGGNQQKVALSRLLEQDADILLLDEPTRGIDVGSKVDIYRLIGKLATRGKAIIFVSSYLPEILSISDTIAVMHRGKLSPKRNRTEWDEIKIMNWATSGTLTIENDYA